MRRAPGKHRCFVLDVVGASMKHGRALFGELPELSKDDGSLAKRVADRADAAPAAPPRKGAEARPPPPPDLVPLGRRPPLDKHNRKECVVKKS